MIKTLLVLGAGGHGKAVAEAASLNGEWLVVFADDRWPALQTCAGYEVVSDIAGVAGLQNISAAIAAVGNNERRQAWCEAILQAGIPLVSVVHSHAFVSPSATIEVGCAIMAGAVVGTDAHLGLAAIVNAGAVVDHDVCLSDFAHLGVGVKLAGGVLVGKRAWLQAGCCAGFGVTVNDDAVVPPGTALSAI